ncbi:MAG: GNAT family N-acetyltransferase [Methylococcales bacterium]
MIYEKSFIESSDKNQQISVESIVIPVLHKILISVVNRSRIVPFLDPNDSIQRDNIISIINKTILTICFDVERNYQEIISLSGHNSELLQLYKCCLLISPDQNIALKSKHRKNTKRLKNRLSEIGEIDFIITKGQDIDKIKFNNFFNLLKASHDQGRVNTRWGIEKNKNLLETILMFQDSLLFELTLNKKPIAFAHCQIMSNNRLVYMIPTYDREYAKFALGMQLLLNIMDYCVSKNMILDIGKGVHGYKEHFNIKNYSLYAIFIFDKNISKLIFKPINLLIKLLILIKRKNKNYQ